MSFLGPFDAFSPLLNAMGWDERPIGYDSSRRTDTRNINPTPTFRAPADPRGWQDRNSVRVDRVTFSMNPRLSKWPRHR